jgi:hypothetical protein
MWPAAKRIGEPLAGHSDDCNQRSLQPRWQDAGLRQRRRHHHSSGMWPTANRWASLSSVTPALSPASPLAQMARHWPPPAKTAPSSFGMWPAVNRWVNRSPGTVIWVNSVAFSPDGTKLASRQQWQRYAIILWDVASRRPVGDAPPRPPRHSCYSLAFSPRRGKTLASEQRRRHHHPVGRGQTRQRSRRSSLFGHDNAGAQPWPSARMERRLASGKRRQQPSSSGM